MADTFTSNFSFIQMTTGTDSSLWGDNCTNNIFTPLDAILGGTQSITMPATGTLTLNLTQWKHKAFLLSGALLANVSLLLPLSVNASGGTPGVGGEFVVWNTCTGNFSVTVATAVSGSTGVTVPQGARATLYSDTINVWYADDALGNPLGALMDFAGTTAPPGWLLCFGQSVLRAQYPGLFNAIGTAWGSVDGTHFTIPDFRGRVTAGLDNMGGSAANRIGTVSTDSGTIVGATLGSTGGSSTHVQIQAELATHAHGVTDPQHTHTAPANRASANDTSGNSFGGGGVSQANLGSLTNPASTGISIQNTGSNQAMAWLQPTAMVNKIIFAGA